MDCTVLSPFPSTAATVSFVSLASGSVCLEDIGGLVTLAAELCFSAAAVDLTFGAKFFGLFPLAEFFGGVCFPLSVFSSEYSRNLFFVGRQL